MRVVICPDKFAGTLSAVQACEVIARAWKSARPDDELVQVPLADGGEGTIKAVTHARPDAVRHEVEVTDARGVATTATWLEFAGQLQGEGLLLRDRRVALIEVAEACGLSTLATEDRDPLRTTTYGVGQLIAAVLEAGMTEIVVGLGGSATVDGGVGMVSALTAHAVRRSDGNAVKVGGRWVADVDHMRDQGGSVSVPEGVHVVLASDVTNPLLGPNGAAAVFGPQKGADAAGVEELESALSKWADVAERDLPGGPWRDIPGAGAAGGLGFALMAVMGAEVRSGADVVSELIGLDLSGAAVVVTGEGSLDAQTLGGKGPEEIRRRAHEAGARTVALAGVIKDDAARFFDLAESLGPNGMSDPVGTLFAAATRAADRFSEL